MQPDLEYSVGREFVTFAPITPAERDAWLDINPEHHTGKAPPVKMSDAELIAALDL